MSRARACVSDCWFVLLGVSTPARADGRRSSKEKTPAIRTRSPTRPPLRRCPISRTARSPAPSSSPSRASAGTRAAERSPPGRTFGALERLEFEQALSIRRWYLGPRTRSRSEDSGGTLKVAASHPEVWGRAVWASHRGTRLRRGTRRRAPGVANHGPSGEAVANSVRVVRPWDYVDFANNAYTLRPFIDVRDIDGPVMLQLRQGIDVTKPSSGPRSSPAGPPSSSATVRAISSGWVSKHGRSTSSSPRSSGPRYALSPSIRLMTKWLRPAASLLVPIDRPLFGAIDNYWALRLSFEVILDPDTVRGR